MSQLSLADDMHEFNARNCTAGRPQGLEPQYRPRQPFHGPMVLLHEIIEILALADGDPGVVGPIVPLNRGVLLPLWSMVIFSGSPWVRIALRKKAAAAARSRVGLNKKSTVWPSVSTARYKQTHCPFTRAYVSSMRQLVPTAAPADGTPSPMPGHT